MSSNINIREKHRREISELRYRDLLHFYKFTVLLWIRIDQEIFEEMQYGSSNNLLFNENYISNINWSKKRKTKQIQTFYFMQKFQSKSLIPKSYLSPSDNLITNNIVDVIFLKIVSKPEALFNFSDTQTTFSWTGCVLFYLR